MSHHAADGGVVSLAPPSFGSHEPLPLSSLLCNFSRRSQDELFELLEGLESRQGLDEATRRRKLFAYLTNKQRQFGEVFALVRWLGENHVYLDRLRDLTAVLDRRAGLLEHTCESMQILQRRVEDRLYPLWDVFTALHVMSTGTYRLLPGIIETRLLAEHQLALAAAGQPPTDNNPLKPPVTQEIIDDTMARLNNALHIKLLGTTLPVDLSRIDIRDGIAYLTYGQEFEIGVSLRMGPAPNDAPHPTESEESRVHWRLYDLKILMNVDQQSSLTTDLTAAAAAAAPLALFNDSQLLHLNVLLNTVAAGQPNPIETICQTMHRLLLVVLMDILYQQSQSLAKLFATQDLHIDYVQASKVLNIRYWKDMKEMPMEGGVSPSQSPASLALAQAQSQRGGVDPKKRDLLLSPCLQILLDDHDRLSIRHNPPLPPSAEFKDLFSLNLQSISVTALLANVLMYHGNQRVEQLFAWIARESRDKGKKVIGCMDMEVTQRRRRGVDGGESSIPHSTVVPRSYLLIRLLPGYTLSIHTDTQTGRFVLEWCYNEAAVDPALECSNLSTFYGGASSALNRILHAESARLNQQIASVFEIILHLKMSCLTAQMAAAASAHSNPRLRVFTMHAPFNAQSAVGIPAAASITQAIKHVVFDARHYRQYTTLPGPHNDLFKRPGFGPYTVYLQLAGYSTNYYVLIQLNPFAQLTPTCFLVQTEPEASKPITVTSASGVQSKPFYPLANPMPVIRQLIELKWPSTQAPPDPSVGFATHAHRASLASLLVEAESLVPLWMLRRDLQINFNFIVSEARVISKAVGMPPGATPLPTTLQQVIQQRTAQATRSTGKEASTSDKDAAPYLVLKLNFPLNYSLYNAANINLEHPVDPTNPTLKHEAYAVVYATPPNTFPDTSQTRATVNGGGAGGVSSASGFIVYFSHPLVSKLMSAVRECDLNAAKSTAWQQVASMLDQSAGVNQWSIDATGGVLTLVYDSITPTRVARFIYDLDNLYVHICMLSSFTKQIENNILDALVNGFGDGAGGMGGGGLGMDEIVEHDAVSAHGGVMPSAHTKKTSLNPIYFPADFYRCVEFNCSQMVFAYVNPDAAESRRHPLCRIVITRDHRRESWKRISNAVQLYPASGGPPKSPGAIADPAEYRLTMTPNAWPQLPFYAIEFNATRPNNILTLLHHIWVAHRTMPPIWRFLVNTQRWQAMADITTNHRLMRLYSIRCCGAMVHSLPESSTRLRLLYGQQDRGKIHDGMWRGKTDLRLIYEGEVVQDYKSGTVLRSAGQDGESTTVRPGKIGGDLTQYLHRWYKHTAMDEFRMVLRRSLRSDPLLSGIRFEFGAHEAEVHLSTPFIQLTFTPPNPAAPNPSPNQLLPPEQHVLSVYFAHRIASPPYLSEPFYPFYQLLIASQNPTAAGHQFHNLRLLLEAWAMELLQPHPFPQPFPQPFDESLLRQVLMPSRSPESSPLTFRFVLHHRAVFDMAFHVNTMMLAFTVEVTETKFLREHKRRSGLLASNGHDSTPHSNGHASVATAASRPFSLFLPLAYQVAQGTLHRWDVPNRVQGGTQKRFTPLLAATLPSTFASLAEALHALMHTSMEQLAEWCSAPPGTATATAAAASAPPPVVPAAAAPAENGHGGEATSGGLGALPPHVVPMLPKDAQAPMHAQQPFNHLLPQA